MNRRVAVTGIGTVSALGNGAAALIGSARAGRSGIRRLDTAFAHRLTDPLAAIADIDDDQLLLPPAKLRMLDRVARLALHSTNRALEAAGDALAGVDAARAGTFIGTGMGGTLSMDDGYRTLYEDGSDRIAPFTVLMGMHNAAASWIGSVHGLRGPQLTFSTACSSATVAIGEAWRRVACGELELALAGGAEAPLSCGSLKAWEALRTLASVHPDDPSASCRPFSADRSGMVLGEGAAVLVLEPWERAVARGADIVGEVIGYAATNEAGHVTRPDVAGQAAAMRAALASAGIDAAQIDTINAHGTGTRANDATETAAIREVFGTYADKVPVSATKSMHGHLLGAAGAIEAALVLLAMRERVVLPTMHLHEADPRCDLDYVPNAAREGVPTRTALSNSFAFGGSNAVLVLRGA